MTAVGMLGLGIMGSAMSGHLLERGFPVVGYDPVPERAELLVTAGGEAGGSVAEVVSRVDVVIASLPTAAAAEQVCTQIASSARVGLVVVETSTLPIESKQRCQQLLAVAGMVLLDCPLSGTGAQALERDVSVYGSGDRAAFELVRPVLEVFARSVRYLGPFGHGSTMKYVANLLVAVHNVATAEAFAFGERAGLDPQLIYETVRDGAGNSVIFDKRGRLMVERQYLPATARVAMFVKDVDLIRAHAATLDLPTPMLDSTVALYRRAAEAGLADADAAALRDLMIEDRLSAPQPKEPPQ